METITILNSQNSHEAALGSWEKISSASFLSIRVKFTALGPESISFVCQREAKKLRM